MSSPLLTLWHLQLSTNSQIDFRVRGGGALEFARNTEQLKPGPPYDKQASCSTSELRMSEAMSAIPIAVLLGSLASLRTSLVKHEGEDLVSQYRNSAGPAKHMGA